MNQVFSNKSRLFLSRSLTLIFMLLPFKQNAYGCAGGFGCEPSGMCNNFFVPEIIDDEKERPFFYGSHHFYDEEWINSSGAINKANIDEWMRYFENKIPEDLLNDLVYKVNIDDIDKLIFSLKGKGTPLEGKLKDIYTLISQNNQQEIAIKALYYLGFAKRVEPVATAAAMENVWSSPDPLKIQARTLKDKEYEKLLKGGESLLEHSQQKFLAQRYRFQILRLMFYSGHYEDVIKYYQTYYPTFVEENSIKYRFSDLAAGAFYKSKSYAQANYLLSNIFSHFPPLRKSSIYLFHSQEEADWKHTLEMAKNVREKTILWQMLGIKHDGTRAIWEIFALDPHSELLNLLLVREVNLFEEALALNPDLANKIAQGDETLATSVTLKTLKMITDSNKLPKEKAWLWNLAVGHLYALTGREENALAYLSKAEKILPSNNKFAYVQWRMSRLLARTMGIGGFDGNKLRIPIKKEDENFLAAELTWLGKDYKSTQVDVDRKARLYEWLRNYLSRVYLKTGDIARSFLLLDKPGDARYQDNTQVDELLKIVSNPRKDPFDVFLTTSKPIYPATQYTVADLIELKGINSLYTYKFSAAAEFFKEGRFAHLKGDPFVIHVKDCHDCDHADPKHKIYTKTEFAGKMAELFTAAQGNSEGAAIASFELANGYYNMSYFGNARDLYYTVHRGSIDLLYSSSPNSPDAPLKSPQNMSEAKKYYMRAYNISTDKELQVKALFMAAKTEQNTMGPIDAYNPQSGAEMKAWIDYQLTGPGIQFKTLADKYSDTLYYKEIIKECGYFRTFLSKRK